MKSRLYSKLDGVISGIHVPSLVIFFHFRPIYANDRVLGKGDKEATSIINDVGDKEFLIGYLGLSIDKPRVL